MAKWIAGVLAAVALFVPSSAAEAQGSVESDRAALEALYHATDGPNWRNNTNWLTVAPLYEWYGVEAGIDGRVTHLALPENGLVGSIPSTLGNLTNLERLYLLSNNLSGPIPSSLGNLTNLKELLLQDNDLSGPIPSSLGNLTDLKELFLELNNLSGSIPSQIGNLTNLEDLHFFRNNLSGPIPSSIGNLTNLVTLSLSVNNLSGPIPSSFGNLTNLEHVWFRTNEDLSGALPSRLRSAPLRTLHIHETQLCAPAEWGEWLATIDFRGDPCRIVASRDEATVEAAVSDAVDNVTTGGTGSLDLTILFTFDAAMLDVTYAVEVAGAAVTATVTGDTLTITAVQTGSATVTVTATSSPRGSSAVTTDQLNANTATVTFDVTVPVTFTLSAPDGLNVTEGESVTVTATASGAVTEDTTVRLVLSSASTAAPSDYTLADSITISAGETTGTAMLMAVADDNAESPETLTLRGMVGDMETDPLTFTIMDALAPLVVTLSASGDGSITEGESVTVTATASRAVEADTTVVLRAVDGTAAPADYTVENITISAGETTGTATLMATTDSDAEGTETLRLQGTVGDLETNVLDFTIADPLAALVVTLSGPEDTNIVEGQSATITATANRAVDADTTVRLITVDGTVAPTDYTVEDITISAGETVGTTTLTATTDDDDTERSETLTIRGLVAGMETHTLTFTIWDAAVPALPAIASLVLAVALAALARRRIVRQ